ncbi:WD repeat-containing protein [Reticulomyxa filosa]|uniref:WD repeat-containing protein n=1 Tax=Reticulomyxa filosa TaxID=46433 RepID=X6NWK3_RETFI|nr:WD repeat-containing protein [Reticulomyxa filosa]|eukprot:ETO30695.1 WD repeat-containing protein [Reticulomyxa filosa]
MSRFVVNNNIFKKDIILVLQPCFFFECLRKGNKQTKNKTTKQSLFLNIFFNKMKKQIFQYLKKIFKTMLSSEFSTSENKKKKLKLLGDQTLVLREQKYLYYDETHQSNYTTSFRANPAGNGNILPVASEKNINYNNIYLQKHKLTGGMNSFGIQTLKHEKDIQKIETTNLRNTKKHINYKFEKKMPTYDIKTEKELKLVLKNWMTLCSIESGWIDEFDKIISRYVECSSHIDYRAKYFKFLKTFQGPSGCACGVKFSLDGKQIVSATNDKKIRIWDVASGNELQILKGHPLRATYVQFSPNAKMVVSCSGDKTVILWDVVSGQEIKRLEGHSGNVRSVQFSPDGDTVVSCSFDNSIRLWDVDSGKEIKKMEGHSHFVNDVKFSKDGKMLVSSSLDKTIGIWDVKSGERIKHLKGHSGVVWKAQFSPDSVSIVSCSKDKTIRIWDVASGKEVRRFDGYPSWVSDIQFSPDGQTIACSMDKTILLVLMKTGLEIQKLEGHFDSILGIDFSPNGKTIVSSSDDGTIRLWG